MKKVTKETNNKSALVKNRRSMYLRDKNKILQAPPPPPTSFSERMMSCRRVKLAVSSTSDTIAKGVNGGGGGI